MHLQLKTNISIILVFLILLIPMSVSADKKLAAFQGEPPAVSPNLEERELLNSKKFIFKTIDAPDGEQLAIMFKVNANPEKVWSIIKDYSQYKNWIKSVKKSEIYKTEQSNIYVHFRIEHWLLGAYEYYIKHTFASPQQSWATWTLDESKPSDFQSAVGFWRVESVEDQDQQSYVSYSSNILFKQKKSKFIRTRAIKSSLKQASSWVKVQSEK